VLTPLIFQAALASGIDPAHLGAVIMANVAPGMVSPPFGLTLFIGPTTFRASNSHVVTAVIPVIGLMFIVLLIVTLIPAVVLLSCGACPVQTGGRRNRAGAFGFQPARV